MKRLSLYQQAIKVMAKDEIDSHYSDLYLKVTDQSRKLVDAYEFKRNVTMFTDNITKTQWYDIPFAYDPYWINIPDKLKFNPQVAEEGMLVYVDISLGLNVLAVIKKLNSGHPHYNHEKFQLSGFGDPVDIKLIRPISDYYLKNRIWKTAESLGLSDTVSRHGIDKVMDKVKEECTTAESLTILINKVILDIK